MLQCSLYGKEPYSVDQSECQNARHLYTWYTSSKTASANPKKMHAKYHFLVNNHSL